jgi:uncharacterized damage-inducible protein DinB
MKTETEKITKLLHRTFGKGAWHGPSVKETLDKVSTDHAHDRLTPNTHSIIELVAHMTSWRTFVTKRLQGDADFQVSEEMNFPKETTWSKVLDDLEQSQEALLTAVNEFPVDKLGELVPHAEFKYTYYTLLHGIIHHDLYHTGQIALIVKGHS